VGDQKSGNDEEQQDADVLHVGEGLGPPADKEIYRMPNANHLRRNGSQKVERQRCVVFFAVEAEHPAPIYHPVP
jgi:hypothetical protein